jgi:beta-galactosidase/beta-glucuronidase
MNMPRSEHPRPDRYRPEWINLNGTWDFKFDPGASGFEQNWQTVTTYDKKIVVPFCMESKLSGIEYKDFMPAVWYRRTFQIPDKWISRRVLLHIGACDFFTRVYVNGKLAGQHSGGYISFSFDITKYIKTGENTLVIEAKDDVRSGLQPSGKQCQSFDSYGCLYTRTTGIWQTVWLESVPHSYIDKFKVYPDFDNSRVLIRIFPAGNPVTGEAEVIVKAEENCIAQSKAKIDNHFVDIIIDLPEARPWSPDDPFLYDLELKLNSSAGEDTLTSYFGLRKVHIEGRNIFLNNKPFYMRTVLDQGFYPDGIYTAPTEEALKHDIELSQAIGFNGARLHQKIFEPRFLYWADKLGYVIWGEHANWGCDFNHPFGCGNFVDEWMEAVDRDFNHPAIIGWCPLNETEKCIGKLPQWVHALLYRLNKVIDPTRLAIDASGYIHYAGCPTDLYDIHNYAMPEKLAKDFEPLKIGNWEKAFKNFPSDISYDGTKPYFVSEYGGIWWQPGQTENNWGYGDRPKTEEEFLERYRQTTQIILDNPEICGWCYTQLTDVEQEVNGLYYYDRRPKFSPKTMAELKRINSAPTKYLEK